MSRADLGGSDVRLTANEAMDAAVFERPDLGNKAEQVWARSRIFGSTWQIVVTESAREPTIRLRRLGVGTDS